MSDESHSATFDVPQSTIIKEHPVETLIRVDHEGEIFVAKIIGGLRKAGNDGMYRTQVYEGGKPLHKFRSVAPEEVVKVLLIP